MSGLEHLLAEGIISEVIGRLKSGKEAEVYVVRYGGKAVAAKVYKDRAQRSFKNNSGYKEGRAVRNTRSQRAMDRGSRFGQAATEDAWKSAEVDALYKLHAAGVRVPAPVMYLEGVLLMELVLDEEGDAAPRVIDTRLTAEQANAAYHDMLGQLVRILTCELIHGDLSPYNVLWGVTGPTIIDFPQIISASHNSRSEAFFLRDARNILGHFASIDPSLNPRSGDAGEIWRTYVRRELTPDFIPQLRTRAVMLQRPPPEPRAREANAHHAPNAPNHPRNQPRGQGGHAHGRGRPPPQQDASGRSGRPASPDRGQQQQRHAPQPQQRHAPPQQHAPHDAHARPNQRPHDAGPPKPQAGHPRGHGAPRRPPQGPEVIVRINRTPQPPRGTEAPRAPRPPEEGAAPKRGVRR